jgi:hypothetical protein
VILRALGGGYIATIGTPSEASRIGFSPFRRRSWQYSARK